MNIYNLEQLSLKGIKVFLLRAPGARCFAANLYVDDIKVARISANGEGDTLCIEPYIRAEAFYSVMTGIDALLQGGVAQSQGIPPYTFSIWVCNQIEDHIRVRRIKQKARRTAGSQKLLA